MTEWNKILKKREEKSIESMGKIEIKVNKRNWVTKNKGTNNVKEKALIDSRK